MGSVAKSYMGKGFLMEAIMEMRKYLTIQYMRRHSSYIRSFDSALNATSHSD